MKTMKHSASCPICKRIFEHEKQLVVNQMLGYHKLTAHGIPGKSADIETKRLMSRESYWKKMGYSPEEIQRRRERYAARHQESAAPTAEGPVRNKPKTREAVPLLLDHCPDCGARFWISRKDKSEETDQKTI